MLYVSFVASFLGDVDILMMWYVSVPKWVSVTFWNHFVMWVVVIMSLKCVFTLNSHSVSIPTRKCVPYDNCRKQTWKRKEHSQSKSIKRFRGTEMWLQDTLISVVKQRDKGGDLRFTRYKSVYSNQPGILYGQHGRQSSARPATKQIWPRAPSVLLRI